MTMKKTKQMGVAACIVLVTLWIASIWFAFGWLRSDGAGVGVMAGVLDVSFPIPGLRGQTIPAGWGVNRHWEHTLWWFDWGRRDVPFFRTPLWVLLVPLLIVTDIACRSDAHNRRSERAGECLNCGYDCRGLPAASVCPECGESPDPLAHQHVESCHEPASQD
jgi:hypothetical protein